MSYALALGEVIDTTFSYAPFTDKVTGIEYQYGTIKIRSRGNATARQPVDLFASPLDLTDINTPLKGELVLLHAKQINAGIGNNLFYSKIVNFHNTVNTNSIPFFNAFEQVTTGASNYNTTGISSNGPIQTPEYLSHVEQDIRPLQPYEGDKLISSRYGSAIRFSSNITKGNSNYFVSNPPWKGSKTNNPILMFTAGLTDSSEYYNIEKPDADKSLLYLTTDQNISITPAQTRIGNAIKPSVYSNAQAIVSSDRIFLNSRKDDITLVGKSTVNIATPSWAVDMDKFFTQVESIQTQLTNLTVQVTTLTTALAASATADIALGIPGAVILSPVATSAIGNLTNITSQLANITAILATLKQ
jgi:hypothetical protein